MIVQTPAREAPAAPPLSQPDPPGVDPSFPAVPNEPVLCIQNIQGNILDGFKKDFQVLLFLEIVDVVAFKAWLRSLVPFIATAAEVIAFNQLFKAIRNRRGESRTIEATWINIAFSYNALARLAPDARAAFVDEAFRQGLAARAADLGDPIDPNHEGHPSKWVVGGPNNEADVLLIIASDDTDDLANEVARIEESITTPSTPEGRPYDSGVRILSRQHGKVLPGPLRGHEHFGFLDGISQPGIRGRLSDNPTDVLTPRQNPNDRDQGKPGQDLLWPGEFVFGYRKQNPAGRTTSDPNGPIAAAGNPGPWWTKDGSFLVFRRLRQDVPGFHRFVRATAQRLGVSDELLGAKLIGRRASGAPLLRAPAEDDRALANDDCANNNFEFQKATSALPAPSVRGVDCAGQPERGVDCAEQFPPSPGDQLGQICPFFAHIRKAYPRDDVDEVDTQTHRLLRRGIPFGEPSPFPVGGHELGYRDRGLLFLAYQTSIVNQFEYVTKQRFNNAIFKDQGVGLDPILGQNNRADGSRERQFTLTITGTDGSRRTERLSAPDWVTPTGGGYFFAPSIAALDGPLSGNEPPPKEQAERGHMPATDPQKPKKNIGELRDAIPPKDSSAYQDLTQGSDASPINWIP